MVYANPNVSRHPYADECGVTFKPIQGTSMDPSGWLGIWVHFWALQVNVRRAGGGTSGGGHYGPQWGDPVTYNTGRHNAINWGAYDEVVGGGSVVRGTWYDYNKVAFGENGLYYYEYGDEISMRCFRSPKQDWAAVDLDPGYLQSAPYTTGSAQQSDETAVRCTIRRNNGPDIFFRDCLFKDAATDYLFGSPLLFSEHLWNSDGNQPSYVVDSFPGSPICDFYDFIWDGRNVVKEWTLTYGGGVGTNTDQRVQSDKYIRHVCATGTTQTNPQDTVIATPTNFYSAPPASSGTSGVGGGSTTRPWFP